MNTWRLIAALLTAGTALTNSIAETVLNAGQYTVPAYYWQKGKALKLRVVVRTPSTNATDTLTVRCRVGPTTLVGTICHATAAVDVANDDTSTFDIEILCRGNPGTGQVLVVSVVASDPGTASAVKSTTKVLTGLDLTAAQLIEITGQWSVANAGNQAQVEIFDVSESA